MQDIRLLSLKCEQCGHEHSVQIDFNKLTNQQLEGREPFLGNFICPDAASMYRIMSFVLDTRVNVLKDCNAGYKTSIENRLKFQWGESDFNLKLERFIKLDLAFIGIPDEYYKLLWSVVSSYCCGYFYPAMTSAGALGERILNRLIIKTRDHFKSSPHYKKIYNKMSFDHWDQPLGILKEWGVINNEVENYFLTLKKYRNDSIHYNDGYNFELNSHDAIGALAAIINAQFSYIKRVDLFWVFDIPGEIWLRSEKIDDPFVKEFVLGGCLKLTPFCEPMDVPPYNGRNVPMKPISDEEFIAIRNSKKNS